MVDVSGVLRGDRRALARMLTMVENRAAGAEDALAALLWHTGQAQIVGVTGAPGVGKSSLVAKLVRTYRTQGKPVAVLAVDPTSPFTGGALLGDRVRMRELSGDPGVFIRSMASRGNSGGLAAAAADLIAVLDAAGFPLILVETVGAGQSEVDIARHAHTVIVVEAPGFGDDVQAIKAGILEIADIIAVNKADDPRAAATAKTLREMLVLGANGMIQRTLHHGRLPELVAQDGADVQPRREVPVLETSTVDGRGISALMEAIEAHRAYLDQSGEGRRRAVLRAASQLDHLLREALLARLLEQIDPRRLSEAIEQVAGRKVAPHRAVQELLETRV